MKKYKIVLLSGDGIGPEISEVSKKVLKNLSKNHNFDIEIIEKLFGELVDEKIIISFDLLETSFTGILNTNPLGGEILHFISFDNCNL